MPWGAVLAVFYRGYGTAALSFMFYGLYVLRY